MTILEEPDDSAPPAICNSGGDQMRWSMGSMSLLMYPAVVVARRRIDPDTSLYTFMNMMAQLIRFELHFIFQKIVNNLYQHVTDLANVSI